MKPRVFLPLLLYTAAMAGEPAVIAHRGGKALRPENTLAAFRHARAQGVPILELDMVVTADDRVVVHHDLKINSAICRPGGGQRLPSMQIRQLRLAQVQAFDCGSLPRPELPDWKAVPGARIPTLEEVLEAFRSEPVEFLAETKMDRDGAPGFVDPARFAGLVLRAVRRFGAERRFILQSGDERTLREMKRLAPEIRLCLINTRRFQGRYLEAARENQVRYLMIHADFITPAEIGQLHGAGLELYSSTANDEGLWRRYRDLGFDGILTDDPNGLLAFLREGGGGRQHKKIQSGK